MTENNVGEVEAERWVWRLVDGRFSVYRVRLSANRLDPPVYIGPLYALETEQDAATMAAALNGRPPEDVATVLVEANAAKGEKQP